MSGLPRLSCAYRELAPGEPLEAGDWWAFNPTGLDDRMTFGAPNWFDHTELGRCFRMNRRDAEWLNGLGKKDDDGAVFREYFEDF